MVRAFNEEKYHAADPIASLHCYVWFDKSNRENSTPFSMMTDFTANLMSRKRKAEDSPDAFETRPAKRPSQISSDGVDDLRNVRLADSLASKVQRPRHEISGPAYQDRSQSTPMTEILSQAANTTDFNKSLAQQRSQRAKWLQDRWRLPQGHEKEENAMMHRKQASQLPASRTYVKIHHSRIEIDTLRSFDLPLESNSVSAIDLSNRSQAHY